MAKRGYKLRILSFLFEFLFNFLFENVVPLVSLIILSFRVFQYCLLLLPIVLDFFYFLGVGCTGECNEL